MNRDHLRSFPHAVKLILSIFLIATSFIINLYPNSIKAQNFEDEISDPFESTNRKIFWFNDKFDGYVLEPIAEGYDWLFPQPIKKGVSNFFENIRFPQYFVSDVIQLKFDQVLHHSGRFLINSTIGLLGTIDVAKDFGLERHEEDIASALAYHGVPSGPYIVLPFIGPSTLRETVGFIADMFLNPLYWVGSYSDMSDSDVELVSYGSTVVRVVSIRASLIDAINTARESSIDYYLFTQGAFYQYRRGILYDGAPPDEDGFSNQSHYEEPEQNAFNNQFLYTPAPVLIRE
jgi:phospholipid-binding lipoprotein MlaA